MATIFETISVRYMTDLIRDFPQLEDFQAAGFPGNMGVESGGFTDVTENNPTSGRGGLGHVQWTASRRVEFETYLDRRRSMGMSYAPDDYEANYGMLFRELDGGEGRRVLPKLRAARDVDEATEIVMREYERPGVLHLEKRKDYGRRALAAFRAAGIDVGALRAEGRPGSVTEQPHNTGIAVPAVPVPAGNPIGGMTALIQSHKEEARKTVMGAIGYFNAFYPDDMIVVQAAKPEETPISQRTGVQLGIGGVVASFAAMAAGKLGLPLGMGETPSMWGNLAPLLSAGVAAVSATGGGWTGLLNAGLSIIGAIGKLKK